eukprot:CAMPEP_0184866972 /NCGR_PEP_ID=MMETSP0580-20130426/24520_1 /TAXON_ID=1118495 /ORGANISM="Dactyliosolen fragilissimus" /LENGTH=1551 /DNA_ID=CAMNT_0027366949 /DNA_START=24 /DNA_END=4679 /DNA_ORIENTATION=+
MLKTKFPKRKDRRTSVTAEGPAGSISNNGNTDTTSRSTHRNPFEDEGVNNNRSLGVRSSSDIFGGSDDEDEEAMGLIPRNNKIKNTGTASSHQPAKVTSTGTPRKNQGGSAGAATNNHNNTPKSTQPKDVDAIQNSASIQKGHSSKNRISKILDWSSSRLEEKSNAMANSTRGSNQNDTKHNKPNNSSGNNNGIGTSATGSGDTKSSTVLATLDKSLHNYLDKSEHNLTSNDSNNNNLNNHSTNRRANRRNFKLKNYRVSDPYDAKEVGDLVCRTAPIAAVDPRSIGGDLDAHLNNNSDSEPNTKGKQFKNSSLMKAKKARRVNECLLSMRVRGFESSKDGTMLLHSTTAGGTQPSSMEPHGMSDLNFPLLKKNMHLHIRQKGKNKLRYICIVRGTNRPLMRRRNNRGSLQDDEDVEETDTLTDGMRDDDSGDGYDALFNPDPEGVDFLGDDNNATGDNKMEQDTMNERQNDIEEHNGETSTHETISPLDEISAFPKLVFLAIYNDGTHPDIRQILGLECLVAVENNASNIEGKDIIRLTFSTGDVVEIDCNVSSAHHDSTHDDEGNPGDISGVMVGDTNTDPSSSSSLMRKEKLIWSLLQVHAILCTSVVERNIHSAKHGGSMDVGGFSTSLSLRSSGTNKPLPPLTVQNIDKAELQYLSTVNGFLSQSPVLRALLERQRNDMEFRLTINNTHDREEKKEVDSAKDEGDMDYMDDIAYDMIMGNYSMLTLFVSDEEKKDAEDVLNNFDWRSLLEASNKTAHVSSTNQNNNPLSTPDNKPGGKNKSDSKSDANNSKGDAALGIADSLSSILQQRMRNLEAETCRRLIAWEDEKYYSITGRSSSRPYHRRDTVEALSLSSLFQTLDSLDSQLEDMEVWLSGRASAIRPLTNDCRDIEEENQQLEQKHKSYDMLGMELHRLLDGLDLPMQTEKILKNPASQIIHDANDKIDVERSKKCVDPIHDAGRQLKGAFDKVEKEGGVHLKAVIEQVEKLSSLADSFCKNVARIVTQIMEQLAVNIIDDYDFKDQAKDCTHDYLAKKIRDTQRSFQSSMLDYIKLIEVIALLKPGFLPALRDAYSELIMEGILSKKRMKLYFASLPGKGSVHMSHVTHDLKEYHAVTLRSRVITEPSTHMKPVHAKDIEKALSEILPVIAREAYFTAALFGLSSKHLDGREKKRNFEATKKSVDYSSQWFKYYMSRICGIASEADAEGKKMQGDPMLSLVASIHLNEAMGSYIDKQKKGGDQSLSLAYVRSTILEFRKKVDKQWVTWVEEQIRWIRSSPGVPPNGKRAGVFTSFAHFPAYLDHVMICCKAGRKKDYEPKLSKIKVVTYYLQKMTGALFASLHECAERESTDQQYAANVMRMENSYFFTQSIKQRGSEISELFRKQITVASTICKQSTDAYLGWMIKREFKSLHGLFSTVSRIRRDVGDSEVAIHVPRSTFERTLTKESNREVMREKIGVVYGRMEKHLSENGGLFPVAWKALVKVLYEWFGKWEKLSSQCYKFKLEPSAVDIVRIAKAAGGVARKKDASQKVNPDRNMNNSSNNPKDEI